MWIIRLSITHGTAATIQTGQLDGANVPASVTATAAVVPVICGVDAEAIATRLTSRADVAATPTVGDVGAQIEAAAGAACVTRAACRTAFPTPIPHIAQFRLLGGTKPSRYSGTVQG